jgi:hypothetical protein
MVHLSWNSLSSNRGIPGPAEIAEFFGQCFGFGRVALAADEVSTI